MSALVHPGAVIDDRYELLSKLGAGGYGVVFQARQLSTGQLVAIKFLHTPEGSVDETALARFQRELSVIAALGHPNIVRLFDTGQLADGGVYAVLQLVHGISLWELLHGEGPMLPSEAVHLMMQVLDALSSAHDLGIIHRDLKPSNIMITAVGARRNAVVLDFGVAGFARSSHAGAVEALTPSGAIGGTPAYMAPEQLQGEEVGPQTDVYAWGLVFVECLTGIRVARGRTVAETMYTHLSPDAHQLPDIVLQHPLGRVLMTALAKNPEDRYASARAVMRDLAECDVADLPQLEPQTRPGLRAPADGDAPGDSGEITSPSGVASRSALAAGIDPDLGAAASVDESTDDHATQPGPLALSAQRTAGNLAGAEVEPEPGAGVPQGVASGARTGERAAWRAAGTGGAGAGASADSGLTAAPTHLDTDPGYSVVADAADTRFSPRAREGGPSSSGQSLIAERRQVAALVCELAALAELSTALDPDDLYAVLTQFHDLGKRIVLDRGGAIARCDGGRIVTYFGYPTAHEDDAARAVDAALALAAATDSLNREPAIAETGLRVAAMAGVHVGMVVAPRPGAGHAGRAAGAGKSGKPRRDRTGRTGGDATPAFAGNLAGNLAIVGDVARVAGRLQESASAGPLISDTVWRLCGETFACEPDGQRPVGAGGQAVEVYRVSWRAPGERAATSPVTPGQPSGAAAGASEQAGPSSAWRVGEPDAGTPAPIIGREAELATLRELWGEVCEGRGRVVLISGEGGIGKTHLARWFRQWLGQEYAHADGAPRHYWIECTASAHLTRSVMQPLARALRARLADASSSRDGAAGDHAAHDPRGGDATAAAAGAADSARAGAGVETPDPAPRPAAAAAAANAGESASRALAPDAGESAPRAFADADADAGESAPRAFADADADAGEPAPRDALAAAGARDRASPGALADAAGVRPAAAITRPGTGFAGPPASRPVSEESLCADAFALAARAPLVLCFDNLHGADPTTRNLVARLADQAPMAPVMLVALTRPPGAPPWGQRAHVTSLKLARLSRKRTESLIHVLSEGRTLHPALLAHLCDKADGVPLFARELTRAALASPGIDDTGDELDARGAIATLTIPEPLRGALMARLDQLGPASPARSTAQIAAIIGREFEFELLAAISDLDHGALIGALAELVAAEILYQRGQPPRARYAFAHALVHEAAYESLLAKTRIRYHARIGEVLERDFAELAGSRPQLVAHHFTRARRHDRAVACWLRAGIHASARAANAESIQHLQHGLALLEREPPSAQRDLVELELQMSLGAPLMATVGYGSPEIERAYSRALDLCRRLDDAPETFPALWGLWSYHNVRADYARSLELAAELEARAGTDPSRRDGGPRTPGAPRTPRTPAAPDDPARPSRLVAAHNARGASLLFTGDIAGAREHFERSIAYYDPEAHAGELRLYGQDPGMFAHTFRSWADLAAGLPDTARRHAELGVARGRQVGHPNSLAFALCFTAMVHHACGAHARTRALADEAVAVCTEHRLLFWLAFARFAHGLACAELGDRAAGIEIMRNALVDRRASGADAMLPRLHSLLGFHIGLAGDVAEGLTVQAQVPATGFDGLARYHEAMWHRVRGRLHALAGGTAADQAARSALEQAVRCADTSGDQLEAIAALAGLVELDRRAGREPGATREDLARRLDGLLEGHDLPVIVDARALVDGA